MLRGRVRMVGPSPVVALPPTPNPYPEPRTRTLHRQRDGAVGEQDHVLHHHGVRSLHIVDSAGVRPTQTWLFAKPYTFAVRGRTSHESLPLLTTPYLTVTELKDLLTILPFHCYCKIFTRL